MGLWSPQARSLGARSLFTRTTEGKRLIICKGFVKKSKIFLASMAEPNLLQTDNDVDQTLYLLHLLQSIQKGQLPPDSGNAHGDIRHDSPHHRLLRTGILH